MNELNEAAKILHLTSSGTGLLPHISSLYIFPTYQFHDKNSWKIMILERTWITVEEYRENDMSESRGITEEMMYHTHPGKVNLSTYITGAATSLSTQQLVIGPQSVPSWICCIQTFRVSKGMLLYWPSLTYTGANSQSVQGHDTH